MGLVRRVKEFVNSKTEKDILTELVDTLTQLAKASAGYYRTQSKEYEIIVENNLKRLDGLADTLIKGGIDPVELLLEEGYVHLIQELEDFNLHLFGKIHSEGEDINIFGDKYYWCKVEDVEVEYPEFMISHYPEIRYVVVNLTAVKSYLAKHINLVIDSLVYKENSTPIRDLEEIARNEHLPLIEIPDIRFVKQHTRGILNELKEDQIRSLSEEERREMRANINNLCFNDYLQSMLFMYSCMTSLPYGNPENKFVTGFITMMHKSCFQLLLKDEDVLKVFLDELRRITCREIPLEVVANKIELNQMQKIARNVFRERYIGGCSDYGYSKEVLSKVRGLKF